MTKNECLRTISLMFALLWIPLLRGQSYSLESYKTTQKDELTFSLQIVYRNTSSHQDLHVKVDSNIAVISSIHTYKNRAVVLGQTGNVGLVEVVDILTARQVDSFYCYQPYFFGESWIAYVQYYPQHGAGNPTDVVRVYNVSKSPSANRYGRQPPVAERYSSQVGISVFPTNVLPGNYSNEVENPGLANQILGPPGFLFTSTKRLLFTSAVGDDFSDMSNQLVAVDFSGGDDLHVKALEIALPFGMLKRPGVNPHFMQIITMQELAPNRIQLNLPASEYGLKGEKQPFVTVNIPSN